MHFSHSLLLLLGQGIAVANAAIARAACAADNCLRAVGATNKGVIFQSQARRDCSSFAVVSVIPSTSTIIDWTTIYPNTATQTSTTLTVFQTSTVYPVTETVTTEALEFQSVTGTVVSTEVISTTTTTTPPASMVTRAAPATSKTVTPSQIPAYATPCSGVTTLATPVTRTLLTVTGTASTTQNVAFTTAVTKTLTTTVIESETITITVPFTTSTTTTTTSVSTQTACAPSVPSGNILTNPGFNDGTYIGWNPGGYGAFANAITSDAQCGMFAASFAVSSSISYARIGQSFNTIDATKRYQIQTYVKQVSGVGTNCFYIVSCQIPGSFSSTGHVIIQTPVNDIPTTFTKMLVTCPLGANQLTTSISLQCNQGTGPITIAVDETAMYPISQVD
ncbi:hypothetical protein VTL71DRAFT_6544 [Oculimacula yallundae]|uniref:CBM-cenC domain-containing protein n=1 Tax=Oculimacula yallundae TaxID=86028 RepID=A0ABR4BXA4_9HELO